MWGAQPLTIVHKDWWKLQSTRRVTRERQCQKIEKQVQYILHDNCHFLATQRILCEYMITVSCTLPHGRRLISIISFQYHAYSLNRLCTMFRKEIQKINRWRCVLLTVVTLVVVRSRPMYLLMRMYHFPLELREQVSCHISIVQTVQVCTCTSTCACLNTRLLYAIILPECSLHKHTSDCSHMSRAPQVHTANYMYV